MASIIHRGKQIGQFGVINPSLTKDLKGEVLYCEIDLEDIVDIREESSVIFKSFSRFPSVKRDISIIVSKDIPFTKIDKIINLFIKNDSILKEYLLFSIYDNEKKIGKNNISYSLSLIYQNEEKTLTDQEVNKDMESLLGKLNKELNIKLRD
jgi:phenylalanyl-tRNA synthetase beta chain